MLASGKRLELDREPHFQGPWPMEFRLSPSPRAAGFRFASSYYAARCKKNTYKYRTELGSTSVTRMQEQSLGRN
jgi:hypothetical protein